jgi:hypothetical protein
MFRDRARIGLDLADLDADAKTGAEEVFFGESATALEEPPHEVANAEEEEWGVTGALGFRADGRRRDDDDDYYDEGYDDDDDDDDEDYDDDFDDDFDDDDDDADGFDDDED